MVCFSILLLLRIPSLNISLTLTIDWMVLIARLFLNLVLLLCVFEKVRSTAEVLCGSAVICSMNSARSLYSDRTCMPFQISTILLFFQESFLRTSSINKDLQWRSISWRLVPAISPGVAANDGAWPKIFRGIQNWIRNINRLHYLANC